MRQPSDFLGKDLQEGVYFDPLEDAVYGVRVLASNSLGFLQGVSLDDNEAPGLVGQGSRQNDTPLGGQWLKVGQVGRPMDFSFGFSIGAVESQDDEFHTCRWHDAASRAELRVILSMFFEWAPVLIAGVRFIPPPDLIFSELPTKIDTSSIPEMGKVAKPDLYILYEHAEFVNCLQICADLLQA